MSVENDVRWTQRFQNFSRAFARLDEVMSGDTDVPDLPDLAKEGVIQRFHYNYELAWLTLMDKMQYDGITLPPPNSAKSVLRMAYNRKYITNIETWLEMVGDRNKTVHTYDLERFNAILLKIKTDYHPVLRDLYSSLAKMQND